MSKHLLLGDIHLGRSLKLGKPGTGSALNSRLADQQYLLDWTLAKAVETGCSSIITTGDVYEEPRPHPILIQIFMAWLKRCEKAGLDVHVITGNHDIIRSGSHTVSALDIVTAVEFPRAKIYKDVTVVNYPGVSFVLQPYTDRRMLDSADPASALKMIQNGLTEATRGLPDGNKKVLVGHLALEGAIYVGDEIDDLLNEIICPLNMFNDFDYVWMGHIHDPQVLQTLTPNAPHIAHVGSMDRSDFSKIEMDHDKILILFDSDTGQHEEIILPTRNIRKIDLTITPDKDTTDFVINYLHFFNAEKSLKDAILRIEIQLQGQETQNADRDKITKYAYQTLGVHYICGFSESRRISIAASDAPAIFDSDTNITVPAAIDAWINNLNTINDDERNVLKKFMYECNLEMRAQ